MPAAPDDVELIDQALQTVEQAMAHCVLHFEPAPSPTTLAHLPEAEREALIRQERDAALQRPEDTAVHFCLHAAGALLDVARTLRVRPPDHAPTPAQRQQEWDALVAHTKLAGRGAYRAALVLADTASARAPSPLTGGAPPAGPDDAQPPAASSAWK